MQQSANQTATSETAHIAGYALPEIGLKLELEEQNAGLERPTGLTMEQP